MDIIEKIRGFWGISIGALLLSLLLGLALGFMGSAPSGGVPTRADKNNTGIEREKNIQPIVKRPPATGNKADGSDSTGSTQPVKNQPKNPRIENIKKRVLASGRTDPLVKVSNVNVGAGKLVVTVMNQQGRTLPRVQLSLFMKIDPIGWQAVTRRALPMSNGKYEFRRLFAGDYQVRCQAAGSYTCEPLDVTIYGNNTTSNVELIVESVRWGQIKFYVHHEDGAIPSIVNVGSLSGDLDARILEGRFKKYAHKFADSQSINSKMTQYRPNVKNGEIGQTVKLGHETKFTFMVNRDGVYYEAAYTFNDTIAPSQNIDITLVKSSKDRDNAPTGSNTFNLELTLSMNGKTDVEFYRVDIRSTLTVGNYRPPQKQTGNTYHFLNLQAGTWYLVAESKTLHTAFVKKIQVGKQQVQSIDIRTSHLRVKVNAGKSPNVRNLSFKVRLRPHDSGMVERVHDAMMNGKSETYMDYIVPEGPLTVQLNDAADTTAVAFTPRSKALNISNGTKAEVTFEINSASTLLFNCVDSSGNPIPYPEFLISFHPAGKVPESDKKSVQVGTNAGTGVVKNVPWGPAYLMIWTSSKDWNNPDLVLKIDLPASKALNLGNVVVP